MNEGRYVIWICKTYRIMYVLMWRTVYVLTRGYFGVYFPSSVAVREINTKITLEWGHKQFVTRVHTLFHFLHDITNKKMMLQTHHPRVSLTRFTLCWWRHNRLVMTSQWPDDCDANTWQVISNSLDIDFIQGNIHSQSCKKVYYFPKPDDTFLSGCPHFLSCITSPCLILHCIGFSQCLICHDLF